MTFSIVGVVPIIHGVAPSFTFLHHNPILLLLCQIICLRCKNCTWLATREGMDSESIWPICSARGIQPIVTSSTAQQYGDSRRLNCFFCQSCCSTHNKVELAPMPPCPVPLDVWNSLRRIDPNSCPTALLVLPLSTRMLTAFTATELQEVSANRVNTVHMGLQYSWNYIEKPLMHVLRGNIQRKE